MTTTRIHVAKGARSPMMSAEAIIDLETSPSPSPTRASIEPTERSMLRETMTSTIPVAMTPTAEVCTERFHRLRGGHETVPPERIWKPTQITMSATSIPTHAKVELEGPDDVAEGSPGHHSGACSGAASRNVSAMRGVIEARR